MVLLFFLRRMIDFHLYVIITTYEHRTLFPQDCKWHIFFEKENLSPISEGRLNILILWLSRNRIINSFASGFQVYEGVSSTAYMTVENLQIPHSLHIWIKIQYFCNTWFHNTRRFDYIS